MRFWACLGPQENPKMLAHWGSLMTPLLSQNQVLQKIRVDPFHMNTLKKSWSEVTYLTYLDTSFILIKVAMHAVFEQQIYLHCVWLCVCVYIYICVSVSVCVWRVCHYIAIMFNLLCFTSHLLLSYIQFRFRVLLLHLFILS